MSGKKVTETTLELFTRANGDVQGIEGFIKNENNFDENSRAYGAYHAQQMTEKLLKGYLKNNNKEPEWGHYLRESYKDALRLDESFKGLEDEIHHLNSYDAGIKYTLQIKVDEKTFGEILKDIKKVYNFPAFQKIYDEFMEKRLCSKIPAERFDKMIEEFDNIVNNDRTTEIESISYKHFDNHEESRLTVKNGYLIDIHNIEGLLPDKSIEGTGRKLTYQTDGSQKKYFLERIYKMNKQDNFRSDLWEVKDNFSDSDAVMFVKNFSK